MTGHHEHSPAHQHTASHEHAAADPTLSPAEHWEQRYASQASVWSGRVNATLAQVVAEFPRGMAIDLGCGEGGEIGRAHV